MECETVSGSVTCLLLGRGITATTSLRILLVIANELSTGFMAAMIPDLVNGSRIHQKEVLFRLLAIPTGESNLASKSETSESDLAIATDKFAGLAATIKSPA